MAHTTGTGVVDRACSLLPRTFRLAVERLSTPDDPPHPERPLIALLCTALDGPQDAVTAGRALGRVLLEAAAAGLATSPLNQALQTADRWRLPAALSLTGVPQYQLRMGIPAADAPAPSRRPLPDLLPPPDGPGKPTVGRSGHEQLA